MIINTNGVFMVSSSINNNFYWLLLMRSVMFSRIVTYQIQTGPCSRLITIFPDGSWTMYVNISYCLTSVAPYSKIKKPSSDFRIAPSGLDLTFLFFGPPDLWNIFFFTKTRFFFLDHVWVFFIFSYSNWAVWKNTIKNIFSATFVWCTIY